MRKWYPFILILFVLSSCSGSPLTPAPTEGIEPTLTPTTPPVVSYFPRPQDASLTRGEVYPDSADLLISGSTPAPVNVVIKGSLPNPCYQLRVLFEPPDADNQVRLQLYSVVDLSLICAQVIQDFELTIPLGTFPAGHYSVWINAINIGEFDS